MQFGIRKSNIIEEDEDLSASQDLADFIENERQESLWAAGWNIFESSQGSNSCESKSRNCYFLEFDLGIINKDLFQRT